ncbi:DUF7344 domain-containing protein [Halomarina rubra]|uniref:DUF7344 domain-containing protein n=1 Tax=Halomarina rubra TaxID=2071873 RepID=A0ABD6AZX8_9EURY|nr:hypothetical protein [Halomarina rubra]
MIRDGDDSTDDEPNTGAPSLDTLFDLLSVERRRLVLYQLTAEHERSLADLTDAVVAAERRRGRRGADRRTVAASLAHVHLPRLVAAGVVEYDREAATVRYRPERTLTACLDWVRRYEEPTPTCE